MNIFKDFKLTSKVSIADKKYYNYLVLFIISLSFVFCILNIRNGHNWGGDFSLYIHQAKSITEGTSSQLAINNKYIVESSSVHTFSPTLYPWGFPILLSPIYAIYNLDYTAFKVLESIFLVCAILIMFFTFRGNNRLQFYNGLFFIAIIAFNSVYIKATNNILSEIPYLLFSFIGLYFILKFLKNPYRNPWVLSLIIGFLLFFCFSIRTEGIVLFFALLVGQVQYLFSIRKTQSRKKTRYILFLVPYFVALVFYFLLKWVLPSGVTSYFNYEYLVNWDTSITNIDSYYQWIKQHLFGDLAIPYLIPIILLLSLLGMVNRFKKDLVLITYFLFLTALFIIWPFRELRYLYSIYPFILYFLIQGLNFIIIKSKKNIFARYSAAFILLVCLSTNIIKTYASTYKSIVRSSEVIYGPEMLESQEVFSYIKSNTKEKDVVGFFKPRVMHLYTNRISLGLFGSMSEIIEKANYYVETKAVGSYFQIPIENRFNKLPDNFRIVFSNKAFNIYKIVKL